MANPNIYPPSPEFVKHAHVKGMEGYRELYQRAADKPELASPGSSVFLEDLRRENLPRAVGQVVRLVHDQDRVGELQHRVPHGDGRPARAAPAA